MENTLSECPGHHLQKSWLSFFKILVSFTKSWLSFPDLGCRRKSWSVELNLGLTFHYVHARAAVSVVSSKPHCDEDLLEHLYGAIFGPGGGQGV